jgi:hypothetical protein
MEGEGKLVRSESTLVESVRAAKEGSQWHELARTGTTTRRQELGSSHWLRHEFESWPWADKLPLGRLRFKQGISRILDLM